MPTWTIINAEIIDWASAYRGPRFHHILCDPPYALEFLGLTWDKPQAQNGNLSHRSRNTATFSDGSFKNFHLYRPNRVANVRCRTCGQWQVDHPGRACSCDKPDFPNANLSQMRQYQQWVAAWSEALIANVLYPGATCAFFGGTRTFHRLAAGLEDGGFEIFDVMMWLYAQGMAKGQNVSKAMDRAAFKAWLAEIDHGLTPAEKRRAASAALSGAVGQDSGQQGAALLDDLIARHWDGPAGTLPPGVRAETSGYKSINAANARIGYRPADYYEDKGASLPITLPATEEAAAWRGYHTGLKPAWEPVILCRAPKQGKTYVYLAQTYGTGALNIDAGRVAVTDNSGVWGTSNETCKSGFNDSPGNSNFRSRQHPGGRWPANLALAHHPGCGAGSCACGCGDCGAAWPADRLGACPNCGGVKVDWLCPVRLLDEQAGDLKSGANNIHRNVRDKGWSGFQDGAHLIGASRVAYGDSGAASRFFYVAKASPWESSAGCEALYWRSDPESPTGYRLVDKTAWQSLPKRRRKKGNIHPTRKPIRLIEKLARILLAPRHVKPRVCIPFFGSGSEGAGVLLAARSLGVAVEISGIENQADYCLIGEKRLSFWSAVDDYEAARKTPRRQNKAATTRSRADQSETNDANP